MSDHGLTMVTCSNGGGPDFSGTFYDPAKIKKTISDHVKFVHDFIVPFGYCDHFKMNMGGRPAGYDTKDDDIKVCADALNQIGEQIMHELDVIADGLPDLGGTVERGGE